MQFFQIKFAILFAADLTILNLYVIIRVQVVQIVILSPEGWVQMDKNITERDDCCMTSTQNTGVYVIREAPKSDEKHAEASAQRIAQALRNTAAYTKK